MQKFTLTKHKRFWNVRGFYVNCVNLQLQAGRSEVNHEKQYIFYTKLERARKYFLSYTMNIYRTKNFLMQVY